METSTSEPQQLQQQQQQQSSFLLEGPNVMQQALQTFQTDQIENSSSVDMKQLLQQQQQQQQLQLLPPPATAAVASFPFFHTNGAATIPLGPPNPQQQQQIQWHQALQSLAAVQQQQQTIPTATTNTSTNDSVNAAAAAAAAAAAVPFLASLTIPHLMQFNQLQQQQQALGTAQVPIPIQPALSTTNTTSSHPQQLPSKKSNGTNGSNVSKITATKRKYVTSTSTDMGSGGGNGTGSSTTTGTSTTKSQKRGLSRKDKASSSIVSASVGSSSHNSASMFNTEGTSSSLSSSLNNHSRTTRTGTSTTSYSHLNYHDSNNNSSTNNIDGMDNIQPPQEKSAAILEKMSASERRRYDRNLREQQRSYRISQQIKELRDVLQQSNVPFRPNKYSILVSVAEYIQQLQGRAIMLDTEHERLINTIRSTTEATTSHSSSNNNGNINGNSESQGGSTLTSNSDGIMDGVVAYRNTSSSNNDDGACCQASPDSLLFVPGIDYEAAFFHCPYPLGVATLDGRLIAANREFESLLNPNYTINQASNNSDNHDLLCDTGSITKSSSSSSNSPMNTMIDQSFFVFIRNHQEIFEAMAALLKQSTTSIERGEGTVTNSPNLLFWHGKVVSSRNEMYPFTITLTNTENDNPKYFNLSAARGA